MITYITPVYDRTALDVTNKTAKAFFNVADWLRIYNNAQIAHAFTQALLRTTITFDAVAAPTITTIPTVAELNTLLVNIDRIREASCLPEIEGLADIKTDWLEGSSADAPDYLDANDWEKVLDLIYTMMSVSIEYFIYCGVSTSGQPRFYQSRFRAFTGWVLPTGSPVRRARSNVATCGAGLTRNNGFRRYA